MGFPSLTPQGVEHIKEQIALMQRLVREVLETDVDYGKTPGIPRPYLFEAGAQKISGAFNCYPGHRRIVYSRDDSEMICFVIEVPIIHRLSQKEVGTGIGAASTQETKHRYRWVSKEDAEFLGYDPDKLKHRYGKHAHDIEYRIPNPEHEDLLQLITHQASKRGFVDAVEGLPGVGSELKKLFGQKGSTDKPDWNTFYGHMQRLGVDSNAVHRRLGVKSLYDWLATGKTLDDAYKEILNQLGKEGMPKAPVDEPPRAPDDVNAISEMLDRDEKLSTGPPPQATVRRDTSQIKNSNDFYKACHADFNLQPKDALAATGHTSEDGISNWEQAYHQVAAVQGTVVVKPEDATTS